MFYSQIYWQIREQQTVIINSRLFIAILLPISPDTFPCCQVSRDYERRISWSSTQKKLCDVRTYLFLFRPFLLQSRAIVFNAYLPQKARSTSADNRETETKPSKQSDYGFLVFESGQLVMVFNVEPVMG